MANPPLEEPKPAFLPAIPLTLTVSEGPRTGEPPHVPENTKKWNLDRAQKTVRSVEHDGRSAEPLIASRREGGESIVFPIASAIGAGEREGPWRKSKEATAHTP
jgi:hypothetical protein